MKVDKRINWKEVSWRLKEMTTTRNVSLVIPLLEGDQDGGVVVNVTPMSEVQSCKGRTLSTKWVRGVLWGWKNLRAAQRENLVVWSIHDDHHNRTIIGLGAYVREEVAHRLGKRLEYAHTLYSSNVRETTPCR